MSITVITVVLIALTALFLFEVISAEIELRKSERFSSRFPLFAARDHLIRLVAQGKLQEDDPGFRYLYIAMNRFLDLEHRWDFFHFHSKILEGVVRMREDADFRRDVEKARRELEESLERNPELGPVLEETDKAIQYLILKRTSPFSLILRVGLLIFLIVTTKSLATAIEFYQQVRENQKHPNVKDLSGLVAAT